MDMIIRAQSRATSGTCQICTEPAKWRVEFLYTGEKHLCKEHYRELTYWKCECGLEHYGLAQTCGGAGSPGHISRCNFVRPDLCRKCNAPTINDLYKIVEYREGHACHACAGNKRVRELKKCGDCFGLGYLAESAVCGVCMGEGIRHITPCAECKGFGRAPGGVDLCGKCKGKCFKEESDGGACHNCSGIGRVKLVCSTCKGVGTQLSPDYVACEVCDETGVCYASSMRWKVGRVYLTDIEPQYRDELRPWIGSYVCFKCANPDIDFTKYREPDPNKPDQEHRCLAPIGKDEEGKPILCQTLLSKNGDKQSCWKHTNLHLCRTCGRRLRIDEIGFCSAHAQCATDECLEKPVEDSIFCLLHQKAKGLGGRMDGGAGEVFRGSKKAKIGPQFQMIVAEETTHRTIIAMTRRAEGAKKRAAKNYKIMAKAKARLAEYREQKFEDEYRAITDLRWRLFDLQDGHPDIEPIEARINDLEEVIEEGSTGEERVRIQLFKKEIERAETRWDADKEVYLRYRKIGTDLGNLLHRIVELKHYSIWDPRSTPIYEGKPEIITCKNCFGQFNARATSPVRVSPVTNLTIPARGKWICPDCNTDNRPVHNEPERIVCERCSEETNKLYRRRFHNTEMRQPGDPIITQISRYQYHFVCLKCKNWRLEDQIPFLQGKGRKWSLKTFREIAKVADERLARRKAKEDEHKVFLEWARGPMTVEAFLASLEAKDVDPDYYLENLKDRWRELFPGKQTAHDRLTAEIAELAATLPEPPVVDDEPPAPTRTRRPEPPERPEVTDPVEVNRLVREWAWERNQLHEGLLSKMEVYKKLKALPDLNLTPEELEELETSSNLKDFERIEKREKALKSLKETEEFIRENMHKFDDVYVPKLVKDKPRVETVVYLEKDVPPPPPSRWDRRK